MARTTKQALRAHLTEMHTTRNPRLAPPATGTLADLVQWHRRHHWRVGPITTGEHGHGHGPGDPGAMPRPEGWTTGGHLIVRTPGLAPTNTPES